MDIMLWPRHHILIRCNSAKASILLKEEHIIPFKSHKLKCVPNASRSNTQLNWRASIWYAFEFV